MKALCCFSLALLLLVVSSEVKAQTAPTGTVGSSGGAILIRFDMQQQADTVLYRFTFNRTIDFDGTIPCFFDRLSFGNGAPPTFTYRPIYPGTCEATSPPSPVVSAYLDSRDFARAIGSGLLLSEGSSYLWTVDGMEMDFLPSLDVVPIAAATALQVSTFSLYAESPTLIAFDIDMNATSLFLHFSDLMDLSTFSPREITLHNPGSQQSFQLIQSLPARTELSFVKTICIQLASPDITTLTSRSICVDSFGGCSISFTSALASNYRTRAVQDISPTRSMRVSKLRTPVQEEYRSNLELTVSYIGCDPVTFPLRVDEVYTVRPGEYITRINCIGGSNITLDRAMRPFEEPYLQVDFRGVSLNFPNGLPLELRGLFTCQSNLLARDIQHYIISNTDAPFIGTPSGMDYSARLFDPITIPLYFGSTSPINLLDSSVEILLTPQSGSAPDASVRRLSSYRAEVFYSEAPNSLSGRFSLQVIAGSVRAMVTVSIAITPPSVDITPSVIAVLSNDTRAPLQCTTNNPRLQVFWVRGGLDVGAQILSSVSEYMLTLPIDEGAEFFCAVRDPDRAGAGVDNRVAVTSAIVTNVQRRLTVYRDEVQLINDQDTILVPDNFRFNLTLRCLGNSFSGVFGLVWVLEPEDGDSMTLDPENNNNYTQVSYGYNEANLTIVNSIMKFRGVLRCQSPSSGLQATVYAAASENVIAEETCEAGDTDSRWGITWSATPSGRRDSQPCPIVGREEEGGAATGFAFRACLEGGRWAEEVNVMDCRSDAIRRLEDVSAQTLLMSTNQTGSDLRMTLSGLSLSLANATKPRMQGYFPQDLSTALTILQSSASVQMMRLNQTLEVNIEVLNNLLDENNVNAWTQLNQVDISGGGIRLFDFITRFSESYVTQRLAVNNSQVDINRSNLYIRGTPLSSGSYEDLTFTSTSLEEATGFGRVTVPSEILENLQPSFVINSAILNLQDMLPLPPQEPNSTVARRGGSIVITVQIPTFQQSATQFNNDQTMSLEFETERVLRASNPVCMIWNSILRQWEDMGVETRETSKGEISEYKTFGVLAAASRPGAFAVLVDQDTDIIDFDASALFYIGCGVVVFTACICIFALIFSCSFDKLRRYYVASLLVHICVCVTLIGSYVILIAGVDVGLPNMAGCIATSALLHYFFTAAFAWLCCEVGAIILFPWFSKSPAISFIVFFFIGWGVPILPVIIGLGALTDHYAASTHCWFYFDGEFASGIFLVNIIPMLIIVVLTVVLLGVSCYTNCSLSGKRFQGQSRSHVWLLLYKSIGVAVSLFLLAISWTFGMLYVNDYNDSAEAVFMVFSIILGVWLMVFYITISIFNQRVDYEVLWETTDGGLRTMDHKKAKQGGYSMSTHLPMTSISSGFGPKRLKDNPLLDKS